MLDNLTWNIVASARGSMFPAKKIKGVMFTTHIVGVDIQI